MARLGGEFAGIVSVEIETDAIEKLHQHFDELLSDGIAITLRSDGKPKTVPTGPAARMDLVSQDHPGILHQVSHVLAEHDVSIENLETSVTAGSMSGERLFKASAELRLPADLQPGTLSDALQETAGDMMAEINLAD